MAEICSVPDYQLGTPDTVLMAYENMLAYELTYSTEGDLKLSDRHNKFTVLRNNR